MTTKLTGTLEIDFDRGVIYFHLNNVGDIKRTGGQITMLRICRLPTPIPESTFLDITHMHGTSWNKPIEYDEEVEDHPGNDNDLFEESRTEHELERILLHGLDQEAKNEG